MTTRFAAVGALAAPLAFAPLPALSADSLALKVLGFSPDGRHFALMQYGPQWEASRFYAETFVIDAGRDRFVAGAPQRTTIDMKDDTTEDNVGPQLKAFVTGAEKRAAGLLGPNRITSRGKLLVRIDTVKTGEHGSGSDRPGVGEAARVRTVSTKHATLGEMKFTLERKELDWPKTSKLGPHKEASACAEEMDPEKGAGFKLTLEYGGRSIAMNDDKTIPASRHCVIDYGLAEVHAFDRPDGKVTLAVIVNMESRGFEGADRSFLAVTRVLDR